MRCGASSASRRSRPCERGPEMETEEYATLLLAPLYGEPTTPSTVDIKRAVAEGRRRRRSRQVLGYAAIAALTALALAGLPAADRLLANAGPAPKGGPAGSPTTSSSPAASGSPTAAGSPAIVQPPEPTAPATATPRPPTRCTLARLPIPSGRTMGLVTGADPTGRYLLGRAYPAPYQVLIWDNGRQVKVDVPGGDQVLYDINSSGTAVGVSYTDSIVPWAYRNGKVSPLPGVSSGEARGINEAGVIVGSRSSAGGIPVRWASPSSPPTDLPLPSDGDWRGLAYSVDEDGTVVGTLSRRGRAIARTAGTSGRRTARYASCPCRSSTARGRPRYAPSRSGTAGSPASPAAARQPSRCGGTCTPARCGRSRSSPCAPAPRTGTAGRSAPPRTVRPCSSPTPER